MASPHTRKPGEPLRLSSRILALTALTVLAWGPASAEQVERKFRFGLAVGSFNAQDEIRSDAGNVLNLLDDEGVTADRYVDPREDAAVTGNLEIKPGTLATVSVQYAISRIVLVEGSAGYQKTDVGEIEVQTDLRGFGDYPVVNMTQSRVPVGELTRVPFQLSGVLRFRPDANFNPYGGAGLGFTLIGFDPSLEFDTLSVSLDASRGAIGTLLTEDNGSGMQAPELSEIRDLTGATVEAQDTFEMHLLAGAELSFGSNWATFIDFRYTFSSRSLKITFNGEEDLGAAVPQGSEPLDSPAGTADYGAMFIIDGGLDAGGPGQPGTGLHYIHGGSVDFGGFSAQAGIRYTF